jgi:hypothetical protein
MRIIFLGVPALLLAGCAVGQDDMRPGPLDAQAKVPAVEYRSAFEHYLPFKEEELEDWRGANDEVGTAGGHAGHRPGEEAGQPTSKPQPGEANK